MFNYPGIEADPLLHICITEPLRRGTARVLRDGPHALLALDHPSSLYFVAADSLDAALSLKDALKDCKFLLLCDAMHEPLAEALELNGRMRCVQAAFYGDVLPPPDPRLTIEVADDAGFERILQCYDIDSPQELSRRRAAGELFFARDHAGTDIGFVGLHAEGCFGMLNVFESQRGKGYGAALEAHILRFCRNRGATPYCQVKEGNTISLSLQEKLHLTTSPTPMLYAWQEGQ